MKPKIVMAALWLAVSYGPVVVADEDLAGPTQDITPVSLSFRRVQAGEFGGGQVLRIFVMFKNVGSIAVRGSRGGVRVGAISNPSTALYGPNGVGGYNLGAAIAPGQQGMFLFYAPLNSLGHCQSVRVSIDTAHSLQSGTTLVYYNDSKVLVAVDPSSIKACVGGLKP